jgi:lipopolysaccharide transport system ATP-binding protein
MLSDMSYSDVIIRVEGLGKKYSLHHEHRESYTALRDVVARKAKAAGRFLNPFTLAGQLTKVRLQAKQERSLSEEEFWALKDVSFELRRGDRVGIIGRNGAGKSTLLKVLSRIIEPTTGRVEIRGRVASLLEVGTGFHPELTGRENIYLNGAILGMTRREIRSKFDEIVDFSEVEKFLDTPVKRYSSGMYVRLAFAVAAHLEPEILVVDEVLAVGDASFQQKCLGKMQDVTDNEGRTVLFVSHNMAAVKQLCSHAIALKDGQITALGEPLRLIDDYLANYSRGALVAEWKDPALMPGDDTFRISRIEICNYDNPHSNIRIDQSIEVSIRYRLIKPLKSTITSIQSSIQLKTPEGVVVFASTCSWIPKDNQSIYTTGPIGECIDKCIIPPYFLNDTSYIIDVFLLNNNANHHAIVRDSIYFTAEEGQRAKEFGDYTGTVIGLVRPSLKWTTEQFN